MKLDELLRRGDVCFFCGSTIGIAGQTKCPKCGKERPTAEEIERVRRATRSGKAGVIALAVVVALLSLVMAYGYLRSRGGPLGIVILWWYGATMVVVLGMMWPWFYLRRHTREMLGNARVRLVFIAAHPWVIFASVVAWTVLSIGQLG